MDVVNVRCWSCEIQTFDLLYYVCHICKHAGVLGFWGFGVNQGLGAVRMLCHVKVAIKAMKETRMTNKASKLNLINTFCRG